MGLAAAAGAGGGWRDKSETRDNFYAAGLYAVPVCLEVCMFDFGGLSKKFVCMHALSPPTL